MPSVSNRQQVPKIWKAFKKRNPPFLQGELAVKFFQANACTKREKRRYLLGKGAINQSAWFSNTEEEHTKWQVQHLVIDIHTLTQSLSQVSE